MRKTHLLNILGAAALCASLNCVFSSGTVNGQDRLRYPDEVGLSSSVSGRVPGQPARQRIGSAEPGLGQPVTTSQLMQTARGRELVKQLRGLLDSRATMGERHPLLPEVQREIEQTRGLLKNLILAREIEDEIEAESLGVKRLADALPAMQEKDLRRLILRLIVRVDELEKDVRELQDQRLSSVRNSDQVSTSTSIRDR